MNLNTISIQDSIPNISYLLIKQVPLFLQNAPQYRSRIPRSQEIDIISIGI